MNLMILTVSMNAAVDISYKLDQLTLDTVNRVSDVTKTAGGKGLNVTRVLQQLGEDVAATGLLGGTLGQFIRGEISGVQDCFMEIQGKTRNCIAIIHEGQQTEILENGPVITDEEAAAFLDKFSSHVETADLVTISGSLPDGLSDDFYKQLIEIAHSYGKRVLLDTKGELLKSTLASKPFLIKPNVDELEQLLDEKMDGEATVVNVLESGYFQDIDWVVVTNGAKGAWVKAGETVYEATIPVIDAVNAVGSGDSVVAGFAAGMSRNFPEIELIKFGLAMGVLNAMEQKTGSINPEKIDWCIKQITVKKLEENR